MADTLENPLISVLEPNLALAAARETAHQAVTVGADFIKINRDHPHWASLRLDAQAEIELIERKINIAFSGMIIEPQYQRAVTRWVQENHGTWAPNSVRALLTDIVKMAGWFRLPRKNNNTGQETDVFRRSFFPMNPRALAQWINEQTNLAAGSKDKLSVASIRRRLASISTLHAGANLRSPSAHSTVQAALNRLIRSAAEQGGGQQKQATALRTQDIQKILDHLAESDDIAALRDQVLLLLAHDTGRRAAELVSFRFEDIQASQDPAGRVGGTILLRRSKTDQSGAGTTLPLSTRTVDVIDAWADRCFPEIGRQPSGPILRGLTATQISSPPGSKEKRFILSPRSTALTTRAAQDIFKHRSAEAGLKGDFSPHSTRVGYVQDLIVDGATLIEIMHAGGWKTDSMVARYGERLVAEKSAAVRRFF